MNYFKRVTVEEFKDYLLTFVKIEQYSDISTEQIKYKDVNGKLIGYTKLKDLTYWIKDNID